MPKSLFEMVTAKAIAAYYEGIASKPCALHGRGPVPRQEEGRPQAGVD